MAIAAVHHRYRLQRELGSGGMGTVYHAFDRLTQTAVAIKRLNLDTDTLILMAETSGDNSLLSLAHEFETLASLRHPNIISVLDYGFDEARSPYLVMEYLTEAQPLTQFARGKPLHRTGHLLLELLQALSYLHRRGVIHRDIKPDNVLVSAGQVKVLDFGLATARGGRGEVAGTLSYIAPEILLGNPATEQSDLYSVGVIVYRLLSGHLPFEADSYDALTHRIIHHPPDLAQLDTANAALRQFIQGLLAKEPARRFSSASEAAHALAAALGLPWAESEEVRESYLQAARFVGRQTELKRLETALDEALQGQGSLWLIGGESGVGKSRLVDELRTRALVKGMQVLRGQGVAEGGLPYQLWRQVARSLALNSDLSALEASVLREIVPDINRLLERDIAAAPPLDDKANRQRLYLTLRDLLYRQPLPGLLLLEDLHWTSESLEMLAILAEQIAGNHLLVIGTFRDDEAPHLPERFPQAERLTLHRLDEGEITALSASMLGESGTRPGVLNLLHRETEGNVFFVVEVVRALAEAAGGLEDIGNMTLPRGVFAGGMQQVVLRRLARVPDEYQLLLKLAAIAGRQLDLGLLKVLAGDQPLEAWLQACNEAAVLEVKEGTWRFSHDKLREALLATLAEADKPALYRQVAEAFEQHHGADSGYQAQLFDWWLQVGDIARVLHYAEPAANEQSQLSNERRALQITESALKVAGPAAPIETRLALELARGNAVLLMTDYPQALEILEQTLQEAEAAGLDLLAARCMQLLSVVHTDNGRDAEGRTYLERALVIFREHDDEEGVARAYLNLSNISRRQGDLADAVQKLEMALPVFRRTQNHFQLAGVWNNLGLIKRRQGDYADALECFTNSRRLAEANGNRRGVCVAWNNIAISYAMLGNDSEALAAFMENYQQSRQLDFRTAAPATINVGVMQVRMGDYRAARDYLLEGVALIRQHNIVVHVLDVLTNLTSVERLLGNLAQAMAYGQEGYEMAVENQVPYHKSLILRELGAVYQDQGRYAAARQAYTDALSELENIGTTQSLDLLFLQVGQLGEDEGKLAEALAWYDRALAEAEKGENQTGIVEAAADQAFVYLRRDDVAAAETALRRCLLLREQLSSPVPKLIMLVSLFGWALRQNLPLPNAAHVWDTIRGHPALTPFMRRQRLSILEEQLAAGPALPAPAASTAPVLDELLGELAECLEE